MPSHRILCLPNKPTNWRNNEIRDQNNNNKTKYASMSMDGIVGLEVRRIGSHDRGGFLHQRILKLELKKN